MRRTAAILMILLACALPARAAAPPPVAMVTDLVGRATNETGKNPLPLRIQSLLREGDRIRLARGAWARVVYMSGAAGGRMERLTGPCLLEVGSAGAKVLEGPATAVRVEREPVRAALVPGSDVRRMAGTVVRGVIALTMKSALEAPPRFTWDSMVPGPFTVSVLEGGREIWSATADKTELAYAGPKLRQDVTYTWIVALPAAPGDTMDSGAEVLGVFRIVSNEARSRLAEAAVRAREMAAATPDDPTPQVLMMTLYSDNLMFAEALPWAREAVRLRPEDAGLHFTLADLLTSLGQSDEARVERDRAFELRKKDEASGGQEGRKP